MASSSLPAPIAILLPRHCFALERGALTGSSKIVASARIDRILQRKYKKETST
jgi:hypothetical protein